MMERIVKCFVSLRGAMRRKGAATCESTVYGGIIEGWRNGWMQWRAVGVVFVVLVFGEVVW